MLSVIIVNYNAGDRLRRCLDCLHAQSFRDFEIIIFDNASSDGSIEANNDRAADAHIIASPNNLGFAAANNRAAEKAKGEWLVFLNPDAYAEPSWLAELVRAAERYPWADAFGSTQLMADNPDLIDGAGDVLHAFGIAYRGHFGWNFEQLPGESECFSPCAAAAMYRASTFRALGGFDETFFCYGEDVDLGMRLRMSGGRAVQVREAVVLHEGSGVTGRHSDFSVYHGHRNRIWLIRKNMPAALFWGCAPLRLAADIAIFGRMLLLGEARVYLRAMIDGYFGGGPIRASNRETRRRSKIGVLGLIPLMSWSPIHLMRRQALHLPMKGEGASAPSSSAEMSAG